MQTEEYTEQRARQYEPLMWTRESEPETPSVASASPLLKRPEDYEWAYYCNHKVQGGNCRNPQKRNDTFCRQHSKLYERKPSRVRDALCSRPARYLVFGLRWGGAGFLLGWCGLYYWQLSFYLILIPLCIALKFMAEWQKRGD